MSAPSIIFYFEAKKWSIYLSRFFFFHLELKLNAAVKQAGPTRTRLHVCKIWWKYYWNYFVNPT